MNWLRLWAIARKELLQVIRDPRSFTLALLLPVVQILLLGYGVNLDIEHVPLCTFDRENSQTSEDLLKAFAASKYFQIVESESNYRGLTRALDSGHCALAVVVPYDFSLRLNDTGRSSVQVILDATDENTATVATGYAQAVVGAFSNAIALDVAGRQGATQIVSPPLSVEYRVWFNEDLVSRDFMIPGLVAMILALVGAQLTSLTIAREWERGTMELLVSTPVKPLELMLGKLAPYLLIGILDTALCIGFAIFWFGVPFRGTLFALGLTSLLYLIVVLGIGYLLSVAIRSQLGASQIALLVTMLPATLLSGYTFPIDQMPVPIQAITYVVYARYFVTIMKAIFLKGLGLAALAKPIAFLAVYAVVITVVASRAFRKTLE